MVDNQEFSLSTDTSAIVQSMKVKGSPENERFYEYLRFLNTKQKEVQQLKEQREALGEGEEAEKEAITEKILQIDKEVKQFIENFHERYPGSLSSNFIKGMTYPEIPEAPKDENGVADSTFELRYFKQHFFDNIDFTDPRLVRTTVWHEKMKYYMDNLPDCGFHYRIGRLYTRFGKK